MAAAATISITGEPPPPTSHPTTSSAEETLSLFTTLLGTFQLKEEDDNENEDDEGELQKVENCNHELMAKTPSASQSPFVLSRNGRLLQVLLASPPPTIRDGDDEPEKLAERSSFSCLSLDHPHGEHHAHNSSKSSSSSSSSSSHTAVMGKDQAEELAASLMGRSIYATAQQPFVAAGEETAATPLLPSPSSSLNISQIPQELLEHFYDSFSVLVDARLRAYASFLAHFGQSLKEEGEKETAAHFEQSRAVANICRKLEILMWLGSHISVDAVVTAFSVVDDDNNDDDNNSNHSSEDDKDSVPGRVITTLPIRLEGVLDLTIPHFHFGVRNTSVTICASGTITGHFDDDLAATDDGDLTTSPVLRAVHLQLNTHELLAAMMEEASHIVSVIVDMTNDACSASASAAAAASLVPPATIRTTTATAGASKLMFPKLPSSSSSSLKKKRSRSNSNDESELPEPVVGGVSLPPPRHTIVTPDLSGYSIGKRVPSFTLDDQNNSSHDAEHQAEKLETTRFTSTTSTHSSEDCPLTPERCANIVDFAICDIDDTILLAGGPAATKRRRLGLV